MTIGSGPDAGSETNLAGPARSSADRIGRPIRFAHVVVVAVVAAALGSAATALVLRSPTDDTVQPAAASSVPDAETSPSPGPVSVESTLVPEPADTGAAETTVPTDDSSDSDGADTAASAIGPDAAARSVVAFAESFDDPSSLDRFEYGVHHAWIANPTAMTWTGDHDESCGAADTVRTITNPTRSDDGTTYYAGMGPDVGVVYWCRDHVMTSFNTGHYAQVALSPKQTFDAIDRICWDQNRTDLGSRNWTQLVVVPLDTYEANGGRLDYVSERLGQDGPGQFGIHPIDETFLMEFTDGGTVAQTGQFVVIDATDNWNTTDRAKRYTVCVDDLEDGTVRVELERDDGVQVRVVEGSVPDGPVRVVFQHDMYNPDKDPGIPNGYTWHWDDVVIATAAESS